MYNLINFLWEMSVCKNAIKNLIMVIIAFLLIKSGMFLIKESFITIK